VKSREVGRTNKSEAGLSLLEVMIAGVVLMLGLLVGVLPMISYGISIMRATDEETIAKQKARQIVESIYGARNSSQLGWDSVNAVGTCTASGTTKVCGVFLTGPQPMYNSGDDGIVGTADDATAGIESITMADGQVRTLNEFTRTITISDYTDPSDGSKSPTLRNLKVDVTYPFANGLTRTYSIQTLISQYK
jgi:hypothetical protein